MNYYLIKTTRGSKWEIVGGIYIIAEEDKERAVNIFKEKYGSVDKIEDVKQITSDIPAIIFEQDPIEE